MALPKRQINGLGDSFLDSLIKSVTGTAITSATAASQPLLDDVERRVAKLLLPVIIFAGGSFLFSVLAFNESRRVRLKVSK
ncbi:MAG: hypothetical protein ACREJC_00155 [Tepidisphaeraceae bacterium]